MRYFLTNEQKQSKSPEPSDESKSPIWHSCITVRYGETERGENWTIKQSMQFNLRNELSLPFLLQSHWLKHHIFNTAPLISDPRKRKRWGREMGAYRTECSLFFYQFKKESKLPSSTAFSKSLTNSLPGSCLRKLLGSFFRQLEKWGSQNKGSNKN